MEEKTGAIVINGIVVAECQYKTIFEEDDE